MFVNIGIIGLFGSNPRFSMILGASTIESTRILLNSTSPDFPNGMANSSGTLGHYLMDHTMGHGAGGDVPGFEDQANQVRRINGIYLPRFRNVTSKHPDFLRGFAYQGGGSRSTWSRGSTTSGLGAGFKHRLTEMGPWEMSLYGFGECLPHESNRVILVHGLNLGRVSIRNNISKPPVC